MSDSALPQQAAEEWFTEAERLVMAYGSAVAVMENSRGHQIADAGEKENSARAELFAHLRKAPGVAPESSPAVPVDDLHRDIMNLPCKFEAAWKTPAPSDWVEGYVNGHRDTRHAAAELVSAVLASQVSQGLPIHKQPDSDGVALGAPARTDLEWFRLPEVFGKFVDYAETPTDANAMRIIRAVTERTTGVIVDAQPSDKDLMDLAIKHGIWDRHDSSFAFGENQLVRCLRAAIAAYGVALDARTCTCHPDDNPPKPCPRKFSLTECRAAGEPEPADGVALPDGGKKHG